MENGISKTLQDALGNDPTAAADMWRAIADGQASASEILTWATHVADKIKKGVLDVNFDHTGRRAEAALKAIKLGGHIDKDRPLKDFVAVYDDFEVISGPPLTRADEVKAIRHFMKSSLDGLPMKNAIKKLDRLRGK